MTSVSLSARLARTLHRALQMVRSLSPPPYPTPVTSTHYFYQAGSLWHRKDSRPDWPRPYTGLYRWWGLYPQHHTPPQSLQHITFIKQGICDIGKTLGQVGQDPTQGSTDGEVFIPTAIPHPNHFNTLPLSSREFVTWVRLLARLARTLHRALQMVRSLSPPPYPTPITSTHYLYQAGSLWYQ